MKQKIKAFFSAQAFEARARQRERSRLLAELDDLEIDREYTSSRTVVVLSRLNHLNREDLRCQYDALPLPSPVVGLLQRFALSGLVLAAIFFIFGGGL